MSAVKQIKIIIMIDMENDQDTFRIFAVLKNWYTLMELFTDAKEGGGNEFSEEK